MKVLRFVPLVTAPVVVSACAALVGLPDVPDLADSGDSFPSDSTTGDSSGSSSGSDSRSSSGSDSGSSSGPESGSGSGPESGSGSGAVSDASDSGGCTPACPYVCIDGGCTGSCTPGAKQCNGLTPQTCDMTGTWQSGTPCTNTCSDGSCAGVCSPGSMQCSGLQPQTCDTTGTWQNTGTACATVCNAGSCSACTNAAVQCNGQQPQTCMSGAWQNMGSLCPFVCSNGACSGTCVPTSTTCSATSNGVETCGPSGTYGNAVACTSSTCVSGACTGVCAPGQTSPAACGTCGTDTRTCSSSGSWQDATCMSTASTQICNTYGSQTCTEGEWSACSCPSGAECLPTSTQPCNTYGSQTCASGTCSWGACSCPAGAECSPGAPRTCGADPSQTCSAGCAWPASACTSGSTRCSDSAHMETCDSCGQWGAATSCPTEQVCTGTSCALPPPPVLVQSAQSPGNPPTDPITIPYYSAQTAGDVNVVVVELFNDDAGYAGAPSVTDTSGNAYTSLGVITGAIYYAGWEACIFVAPNIKAAAAGANTVSVSASATSSLVDLYEYSGVATYEALGTGSGAAPPASWTILHTSGSNEIVIASFGSPYGTEGTPSGWSFLNGWTFGPNSSGGAGVQAQTLAMPESNVNVSSMVSADQWVSVAIGLIP